MRTANIDTLGPISIIIPTLISVSASSVIEYAIMAALSLIAMVNFIKAIKQKTGTHPPQIIVIDTDTANLPEERFEQFMVNDHDLGLGRFHTPLLGDGADVETLRTIYEPPPEYLEPHPAT